MFEYLGHVLEDTVNVKDMLNMLDSSILRNTRYYNKAIQYGYYNADIYLDKIETLKKIKAFILSKAEV